MGQASREGRPESVALVRGLTLLDATLPIAGSVVGSGVFFAPFAAPA